jgi:hypothetical protein
MQLIIAAMRDNEGVQTVAEKRQHAEACFAVVATRVFDDKRRPPLELRRLLKGQIALGNVSRIFGRVERDRQSIFRYCEKHGDARSFRNGEAGNHIGPTQHRRAGAAKRIPPKWWSRGGGPNPPYILNTARPQK